MPRDRKEPDSEMVDQDQLVTHAKLHVFTTHGKSFTFNNVCDVESNESQLSFTYKAQSDGMWKIAYFFMANVAGFSVLEA